MALRHYRWRSSCENEVMLLSYSYCFDCFKLEIRFRNQRSIQSNSIVCVPCTSIREDDLISGLKTVQDLNGVHGALAELYRSARRFRGAVDELEHADGVVLLSECRPAHVNDVIQMFELDRSIDTEIGSRALRQRLVEFHFYCQCPLLHCRIDARDVTVRSAIPSSDPCSLT